MEILKRSSLLGTLLLLAIALVSTRVYTLWQEGPWDLPNPGLGKGPSSVGEADEKSTGQPSGARSPGTKNIIEKNLFDPERGASLTKEAEASTVAVQRIRSMILLGTAILGSSRYAILQGPSDLRAPAPGTKARPADTLRLKLGDLVEGFKLSDVQEKKVMFSKGSSKVELILDYSRKVEQPRQKAAAPAPARPAAPPQKGQVPVPPAGP